jgi:hypothetical protein
MRGDWLDEIPEFVDLDVQVGANQRFATWVRDSADRPPVSWRLN